MAVEFSVIKEADLLSFRDAKEFSDEEGDDSLFKVAVIIAKERFFGFCGNMKNSPSKTIYLSTRSPKSI